MRRANRPTTDLFASPGYHARRPKRDKSQSQNNFNPPVRHGGRFELGVFQLAAQGGAGRHAAGERVLVIRHVLPDACARRIAAARLP